MCKIQNNRGTRAALKYLLKSVRWLIRVVEYGRGEEVRQNLAYKNRKVFFRFGSLMELKGVTKRNFDSKATLARWYCDRSSCFCTGKKWVFTAHYEACHKQRSGLLRNNGCEITSLVVATLLGICGDGSDGQSVDQCFEVARRQASDNGRCVVTISVPGRCSE